MPALRTKSFYTISQFCKMSLEMTPLEFSQFPVLRQIPDLQLSFNCFCTWSKEKDKSLCITIQSTSHSHRRPKTGKTSVNREGIYGGESLPSDKL